MIVVACLFVATSAACGGSSKISCANGTTGLGQRTGPEATSVATSTPGSSGGSSPNSGGGDINACTLVSPSKLSTLAGHPYTAAKSQTIANGQDQCAAGGGSGTVSIDVGKAVVAALG